MLLKPCAKFQIALEQGHVFSQQKRYNRTNSDQSLRCYVGEETGIIISVAQLDFPAQTMRTGAHEETSSLCPRVSTPCIAHLVNLCFFMYFMAQLLQGRLPSHFVLRARQRSQLAHSASPALSPSLIVDSITMRERKMRVGNYRGNLFTATSNGFVAASDEYCTGDFSGRRTCAESICVKLLLASTHLQASCRNGGIYGTRREALLEISRLWSAKQ